MRALLPLILTALTVPLPSCTGDDTSQSAASPSEDTTTISFEKEGRLAFLQDQDTLVTLDLEVADTDSARNRGMMQRKGFPSERSGMLFPFREERERGFWMANTPLSLDLFFINADSQVVRIKKYAPPNTAKTIPSRSPAQYVLETTAGFADSYGIVEGDRVRWRRTGQPNEDL
ncbi:MAG: DUF192 domain-containing protein [Bacteroidetes bacterium QH_7_62_13]|nr:MAG: DUF192 domain-containing protein [Bacteroidetes bacterium QH_7_62_13]